MEKVFLVDAYALIFRFYYAFIGTADAQCGRVNTSAVFGFVKFLKDLILRERPHYLGVAFDPPGGNFRHELYADYKATAARRPKTSSRRFRISSRCSRRCAFRCSRFPATKPTT